MKRIVLILLSLPLAAGLLGQVRGSGDLEELERSFRNPPDDSRIMMRWWWFGPAVTETELGRQMRFMKEGGIGGFEVQPVYPLELDDADTGITTLPFLSDEFLEALRFTADEAGELGLRFDLTLGSGWPYGGPSVPLSEAAGRLRVEQVEAAPGGRRIPLPGIGAGEELIAALLPGTERGGAVSEGRLLDIEDGAAWLPAGLEGADTVYFFIASRSGMQVKRPAVGGEGFVLDHFDPRAIGSYLSNVGDRLMGVLGSNRPYAVFTDSLEVYNSDWTGDFLEEFERRRGYDLKPYLIALVSDTGTDAEALRRDWGRTLTELFNERFLMPLHQWAGSKGTRLRVQAYGTPAVALSSNAYVDLSEGEGHQWDRLTATRWASSASHIYGRAVTSSETWTWLNSPPFAATPLDMKAEADRHFLEGINQLVGHGWPYSPEDATWPGWHFYAAGAFNAQNPWWIVMPDVARYLQRVSFLMRQGQPANDIAIYLPNDDAWARFTSGNVNLIDILRQRVGNDLIPAVLGAGHGFDFFDDEAFREAGAVEDGTLRLGPNAYKVVILPNVERIPPETLARLEEFARGGGVLIATRRTPQEIPGFRAAPEDRQALVGLSNRLFRGTSASGHFVEDETTLGGMLKDSLQPDVALAPPAPQIGFVHRHLDDAEIYFLANTGNSPSSVTATFRIGDMIPEWWDPMTGSVRPASVEEVSESGTRVSVDLEPYGSRILVFTRRALPVPVRGGPEPVPDPIDLGSGWQVSFGGDATQPMDSLRSWTEDEETLYFSGVATYERTVSVPDNLLRDGLEVRLDLGEARSVEAEPPRGASANAFRTALEAPVRDAAVVYVNGRRAGSVWLPPYSIEVTSLLRPGENQIRIEVANTAMNYMAGHALPDYRLLNLRYGERFQVQDLERIRPLPSGLLGPIRLIAVAPR